MGDNLIAQIANEFVSGSEELVDIITFAEAPWGLNLKLFPMQKLVLKSFYGLELNDVDKNIHIPDVINEKTLYTFTEQEALKWMYEEGRCNTDFTNGKNFNELIMVIGRRGSKSTMSACISNYELYKLIKRGDPAKYFKFPNNSSISILNVAPTDEQSGIVFDMIKSMAMGCPYLKDRALNETLTYFNLQTDSDLKMTGKPKASIQSIAGGCSSNALRGRNAIIVIMDEMAFFLDNGGRFSGEEVYKALTPSVADFKGEGRVICMSSPYAKYGKFYDLYNDSFEEPDNTLMFRMYSSMINNGIPTDILKTARRRDRIGFMCEYGGEFSDSITAWIEDEVEFKKCVVEGKSAPSRGVPDTNYFMGIDVGFRNDGTAIAIVHKDEDTGKIVLDYADVFFAGSSDVWESDRSIYLECDKYRDKDVLVMEDMVKEVKELCRWFPTRSGTFDQFQGYALLELLHSAGLTQFEMTNCSENINSQMYQLIKLLYAEQLLELYDHPVLVPELMSLEAEKRSKSKILVQAPNRRGAHDDISDAFIRAVWACHSAEKASPPRVSTGAGGSIGGGFGKVETKQSFDLRKRRMHGSHPRLDTKSGRRLPGAVRR